MTFMLILSCSTSWMNIRLINMQGNRWCFKTWSLCLNRCLLGRWSSISSYCVWRYVIFTILRCKTRLLNASPSCLTFLRMLLILVEGPCRSTLASLQHDYKLNFRYEGKVWAKFFPLTPKRAYLFVPSNAYNTTWDGGMVGWWSLRIAWFVPKISCKHDYHYSWCPKSPKKIGSSTTGFSSWMVP